MSILIQQIPVGGFSDNFSYVVSCSETKQGVIIDPCGDVQKIFSQIRKNNISPMFIFLTHAHFDHVDGLEAVKKQFPVPVVAHAAECYPVDRTIHDDETITVGTITFTFLHTPGHTAGSVCILVADSLFSGDTLFVGACGRTDLGGDARQLYVSLQRLAQLPDATILYPGHGYGGSTSTLGEEKATNPFLRATKQEFLRMHSVY